MYVLRNSSLSLLTLVFSFLISSCSKDDANANDIIINTSDFVITMDENPDNGQVIGIIQGSTNEGSLTFSIIQQSPSGGFAIDAISGELSVVDASVFRFDRNPEITGKVEVRNGKVFENVSVTIILKEIIEEKVYNGDLWFINQEALDAFGALGYTRISGSLEIGDLYNDSNINNLKALESIKNIDGDLDIQNVSLLPNLEGLNSLESIGGNLSIAVNDILINIEALSQITQILGDLFLYGNEQLVEHTGLHKISSVKGDLTIWSFYHTHIIGLSNISTIGGDLKIYNNSAIESINMNNITHIGGSLIIKSNPKLTNLDFITDLSEIGKDLEITYNEALKNFCILQPLLRANKLAGMYTVNNNFYNPTKQDIIDGNCTI